MIPDSGKGSVGAVIVEGRGELSNERIISKYEGSIDSTSTIVYSIPVTSHTLLNYSFRIDLHSLLVNKVNTSYPYTCIFPSTLELGAGSGAQYRPDLGYRVHFSVDTILPVQDPTIGYTVGFSSTAIFSLLSKNIEFRISGIKGVKQHVTWDDNMGHDYGKYEDVSYPDFVIIARMDSLFQIKDTSYNYSDPLRYYSSYQSKGVVSYPPPLKAIALQFDPSIIAPTNGSKNLGTNDIKFLWDSLMLMDSYRIQVSKDSITNSQHKGQAQQSIQYIVDTTFAFLSFQLPPLEKNTKYFWRVCGVNSEGESRWSDVWSFTTGEQAGVKAASQEEVSLSCYPNPSSKEITIRYSALQNAPAKILIYDMSGKLISMMNLPSEANELRYDASVLPAGAYILGLISVREQRTQVINVVR
jgi:hypothetical protein